MSRSKSEFRDVFVRNPENKNVIRIDSSWIEEGYWAKWSGSAKAVILVIFSHCNAKGECNPGLKRIAIMAGLSRPTVAKALKELEQFKDFKVTKKNPARGRPRNHYYLKPTPIGKAHAIFMSTRFFREGFWRSISGNAKAVFTVLIY